MYAVVKVFFSFHFQDQKGAQLYLGINHCGILTFQGSRKTHHFRWPEVQKINFEGKMFIVHLTISEVNASSFNFISSNYKHTAGIELLIQISFDRKLS